MEREEFKAPGAFLTVPVPIRSVPKKSRSAKSHIEYIRMIESNEDPLGLSGKDPQVFTMDQVALHNTENDAWIVLNDKVYDMTMYVAYHPGGKIILSCAGKDGTNMFMRYHPWVNIQSLLGKLQIGVISKKNVLF